MYRPPDVETINDFLQYYRSSFIGYRDPTGLYIPIYIHGHDGADRIRVNNHDGTNRAIPFQHILERCQFGCPQYGTAEIDNAVIFVARRSARSQYRGHRSSLVRFNVLGIGAETIPMNGLMDSWKYVSMLFNPVYRRFNEAYDLLMEGGRYGCAQ